MAQIREAAARQAWSRIARGSVDLGEGVSGPKAKRSPTQSFEKVSRGRAPKVKKKVFEKGPFSDFF